MSLYQTPVVQFDINTKYVIQFDNSSQNMMQRHIWKDGNEITVQDWIYAGNGKIKDHWIEVNEFKTDYSLFR